MVYHNFKPGSRVEVRSDDEGFKGACYLATVLENLENNKYLVAYDDLMESEDKDSNRLTETVHAQDLRPLPPVDRDEMIKIHDVVDAYHQDGWWTGQVIEILEEGKLVVYFQNPPDELIVHRNHLRLHLDWVDGRWEKPNKQAQNHKMISRGTEVEVTFEGENYNVWHLGSVLQVEGNDRFLVKYRCLGLENKAEFRTEVIDSRCIRPAPPRVEERDFDVLHKVEACYFSCWWTGVIRRIVEDRKYVVLVSHSRIEIECDHFNLRPRLDWIDGKWTTTILNTKLLAINNERFTSNIRKSTPKKLHSGKYHGTTNVENATGKKNDAAVRVDKDITSVKEELGASSVIPVTKNPKKQMRDLLNTEGLHGGKRSLNKKRGRLGKLSLEEQTAESDAGKDNVMLKTIDKKANEDQFLLSRKEFKKLIVAERRVLNHFHRRNEFLSRITNISQVEDQTNETGIYAKIENLPNESLSDIYKEIKANKNSTKNRADRIVKKQRTRFRQQGVTTSIHVTEDQANETVAKQIDNHNAEDELLTDGPLCDLSNGQPLLSGALLVGDKFAAATDGEKQSQKSSAVATKDMAHFLALQNNIATDLEKHGFEVEPIRARLTLLLSKKAEERKLESEYKQIEEKITNNMLEKNELDEEIIQINQKIKELSESLNEAQYRKVIKEDEISTLHSKHEAILANVCSIKREFESIAAGSL
uniref:Agenet domain-containing protein n=1 Tax=Daucus carota subsp. sativus TaxID=79200 RepID=A0A166GRG4_DAUCS